MTEVLARLGNLLYWLCTGVGVVGTLGTVGGRNLLVRPITSGGRTLPLPPRSQLCFGALAARSDTF